MILIQTTKAGNQIWVDKIYWKHPLIKNIKDFINIEGYDTSNLGFGNSY